HPRHLHSFPTRRSSDLGEFRGPRLALIQPRLQIRLSQSHARRAAIHGATNRRTMALAPGRHAEKMAKGVQAHISTPDLPQRIAADRKSTRLNSSHVKIS